MPPGEGIENIAPVRVVRLGLVRLVYLYAEQLVKSKIKKFGKPCLFPDFDNYIFNFSTLKSFYIRAILRLHYSAFSLLHWGYSTFSLLHSVFPRTVALRSAARSAGLSANSCCITQS